MPEYLETTVDKFTFRVATDRLYTSAGVWVLRLQGEAGNRVRIGLTDYLQQSSGDVAFVSVKPLGTRLAVGDECAELETMKTAVSLLSSASGTIVEINRALELNPELVNQDPYEKGWLAVIETSEWEAERKNLLEPSAYLSAMQAQIQDELKQS
jgi:glycine cleavage system H protein